MLDIDSPDFARFDTTDQQWLERFASRLVGMWPTIAAAAGPDEEHTI